MTGLIRTSAHQASMIQFRDSKCPYTPMAELNARILAMGDDDPPEERAKQDRPIKHGTVHAYKKHKCPCLLCVAANRDYERMRVRKARR